MDKSLIESSLASLPEIKTGLLVHEDEVWEETDGRAHFIAMRRRLPGLPGAERGLPVMSLLVDGPQAERARVVREFSEAIGSSPHSGRIDRRLTHAVDQLLWVYHGE